jgi:hypothetical protein
MFRNLVALGSLVTGILVIPASAACQSVQNAPEQDPVYVGERPEQHAQVRLVEGRVIVRKGEIEEELTRGVPLSEGDVVESRGRGVLQLADGTRLAFGEGARFTLAGLFVERKGERLVLIRLDRGRLRVQLGSQSEAVIRVDTPDGSGQLSDRANASFEVDADQSARIRVHGGRLQFSNEADRTTLAAGERLTVYGSQDALNRIRTFNTYEGDPFDRWAENQFLVQRGPSYDRLPAEIRYYADDLDGQGEWVEVEETGTWAWRPTGLGADWRPYSQGRWGAYADGMTWISDEPWGYVTHHHGRWDWNARWGWYWSPGIAYAPAWVAWNFVDGWSGWAPLNYWNWPSVWGYGAWRNGYCWNIVDSRYLNNGRLHGRMHSDGGIIDRFGRGAPVVRGPEGRMTTPPWQQTPLIVRPGEWRDPAQITRVATQREVQRQRLAELDRQGPTRLTTSGSVLRGSERVPFNRITPVMPDRPPLVRDRAERNPGPPRTITGAPTPRRGEESRGEVRQDPPRREELPGFRPRPEAPPSRGIERPRPPQGPPARDMNIPRREESRRREEPRPAPRQEARPAPPPARNESRPAPAAPPRSAPPPPAKGEVKGERKVG